MTFAILQVFFIVAFPLAAIALSRANPVFRWISPVVLCYAVGLLLANVNFIPVDQSVSLTISEVSIPVAIVLILFAVNFKKWIYSAKKAIFSFLLCVIGSVASSIAAAYIFADRIKDAWKVAGMTVGVYTGGTPNMSAIGMSLGVEEEIFILLNASDVVLGGAYLIFLFTIAHRLARKLLPQRDADENAPDNDEAGRGALKQRIISWAAALALALAILGASAGISIAIAGKISAVAVILTVTTLAVLTSFIPRIRRLHNVYDLGEYTLLVFCVAIGSLADFTELAGNISTIFYFCMTVMFGAIAIHFILAMIFRVDADTMMITSVAGIYGPAFVPPVASVMRNREAAVTGVATGIIGYAVANYLGILVAYMLQP